MLPVNYTDVEFLKGGLMSTGVLHEMLIQHKKRLAVHRYCEMAARLMTPGSFPLWLLYGVQVAAAGTVVDNANQLLITDLKGPVHFMPVFKANF